MEAASVTAPVPVDILLSFAFHSSLDHHAVKERLPAGSLIWIDSGAFTAFTTGKEFTVPQYADHLERTRGAWDYAFTLDVIGDHKATMRQTEQLIEMGYPVLPIYTYGTPIAEFRSMCKEFGYIGCGGIVPLGKNPQFQAKYLRTLSDIGREYGTGLHALGVGGRQTVIRAKVWSADSSTVSSAPLYGNVPIYVRSRKKLVMLQAKDTEGLYRYRDDLLAYGFPLDKIMRSGKWSSKERPAMFRASLLSVAQMWADVREEFPVPAPERLPHPDSWTYKKEEEVLDGPRTAYAMGPENEKNLEHAMSGPHVAHAAHAADMGDRMEAALGGARGVSALTTGEGVRGVSALGANHDTKAIIEGEIEQ